MESRKQAARRTRLAAALGATFAAGPAVAAGLDTYWPDAAQVGALVPRANVFAEALDATDARFGDVPAVHALIERLRQEAFKGLRPGSRDWGAGIDLDRGLALFKAKDGLRLVVGVRGEGAEANARALHLLEPLEEKGETARCAVAEGYLVCETGRITGRNAAPAGAAPPPGAIAWLWATEGVESMAAPGLQVRAVTAWLVQSAERFSLGAQGDFTFDPAMRGQPLSPESLWHILTPARPTAKPSLVASEAGGALKVDVDLPRAIALARQVSGPPPEGFAGPVAAFEAGLTGEMALTFDGGLTHPVFLFGLAPGKAGDAVLAGLAELISLGGGKVALAPCADAQEQTCLEISVESTTTGADAAYPGVPELRPAAAVSTPTSFHFTFHTRRIGDTLVVGTTAADVARRAEPGFVSAPWPPSLAPAGASGVTFPAFAAYAGMLGAAPFFSASADAQWFIDAEILSALLGALVEGVEISFQPGPQHARVEMIWRTM